MAQKVPFSYLDRVGIGPTTTTSATAIAPSTRCLLAVHKRREIPARAERSENFQQLSTVQQGREKISRN
jgi:hypothetical protein